MRLFKFAFFISLLGHLLLFSLYVIYSYIYYQQNDSDEFLNVNLVDVKELERGQIIFDKFKNNDISPENYKFLSEKNNRVEYEKIYNNLVFKPEARFNQTNNHNDNKVRELAKSEDNNDDYTVFNEDFDEDGYISLNTKEFKYFSYFKRLKERIEFVFNVPEEAFYNSNVKATYGIAGFVIAKDGSLIDFKILKSTGNKWFDASIALAVKRAAPFEPLPSSINLEVLPVKGIFYFSVVGNLY